MSPDLRLRHTRTRDFGDEIFEALQSPAPRRRFYAPDPLAIAAVACIIGLLWLLLSRLSAPAVGGSGIGYFYETRENPKSYRLHLSAAHTGTFYVLEETKAQKFKILLPTLSYSGPTVRYLGVSSVEFPPKGWLTPDPLRPDSLWVIWSKQPMGDLEALARLQRTNPAVADAGLEAPATAALVERFRQTGGGQVSPAVAVQRVPLPAE